MINISCAVSFTRRTAFATLATFILSFPSIAAVILPNNWLRYAKPPSHLPNAEVQFTISFPILVDGKLSRQDADFQDRMDYILHSGDILHVRFENPKTHLNVLGSLGRLVMREILSQSGYYALDSTLVREINNKGRHCNQTDALTSIGWEILSWYYNPKTRETIAVSEEFWGRPAGTCDAPFINGTSTLRITEMSDRLGVAVDFSLID